MTSDPSLTTEVPVLVAGGGPVGVVLAMDLARLGVRAAVLEERLEVPPNPRCNTTNARSMELLRRLGCADAVRDTGLPADHNTDVVYLTTLSGHELTRYRRSTTAEVRAGRQHDVAANWPTPEPQHFLSQLFLEPVLRRHARDHWGVELLEGWSFRHFEQDDDGVTSVACELASGAERRFRSQFLVGADGSNSAIRAAIGARLEGVPSLGRTCSTFFRSPELSAIGRDVPGWMFRFLGGAVLVAIDGEDRWLIHNGVPGAEDLDAFDPEPAMFAAIGQPFGYEVLGRARWTARAMVATKFRESRVFLAGDAAHLWIPMGGFGMNAGIADAVSLSWRLAGVLDGWLDPRILDTYEVERAPLGGRIAAQAARWGRDLRPLMAAGADDVRRLDADPAARAELGERIRVTNLGEFECPGFQLGYIYEGSPVICHEASGPPRSTLEHYVESSWPGVRLPHVWRPDGMSLYDQLGPGFTLLRCGRASGAVLTEAAEARGLPWRTVDLSAEEVAERYDGFGLVLVRPDQHVVWRANAEPTETEAAEVLDRVTGAALTDRAVALWLAQPLAEGFRFGEGLRWRPAPGGVAGDDGHAGKLVFSDMTGGRLMGADPVSGALEVLAEVPGQPNGLGLLPDGRLVVASMFDHRLLVERVPGDPGAGLELYADLTSVATGYLGDLVVDPAGRVFVGDTGVRVLHGEPFGARLGRLLRVDGPGHVAVALEGLSFPNGMVVTPDGQMLVLGLSGTGRIVQCRLRASDGGALGAPRPFASQLPDGLAIDPDGAVWACHPGRGEVTRYDSGGRATGQVRIPDGRAIACALEPDGRALYVVGIRPLPRGADLFDAMAQRRTRGVLWRALLR